jgi:hypothetical protein
MGITQQIGASSLIKPGVIDNAAARPASPYEGQVIFQKDTDQLLVWNGTAWVIPNSPAQNPQGLELITPAVTGTGVTVSSNGTVTFTAASSIGIIDCFSSLYTNYRVVFNITNSGSETGKEIRLQVRNSGGTITTNTYAYQQSHFNYGGSTIGSGAYGTAYTIIIPNSYYTATPDNAFFDVQIMPTKFAYYGGGKSNGAAIPAIGPIGGECFNTVSVATGLTFTTSASTITGTVNVYGYRV